MSDSLNLEPIFQEMEVEDSPRSGSYQRRVLAESPGMIYIGVSKPGNVRQVRFLFSTSVLPAEYDLPDFRVLGVVKEAEGDRTAVRLHASQSGFNEVFTSLVEDVARQIGREPDEAAAAITLRNRLLQWQRLLQKDRWNGLTDEEQRGLYGELCTLEEVALGTLSPLEALRCWTGPEGTAKDFQFTGAVALEVKTSLARPPHNIAISSERQLDDTGLDALYLLHRLVDAQRGAGETLPTRVAHLRQLLGSDPAALSLFEDCLETAGYYDLHAGRYESVGFTARGVHLYYVVEGFPRLTEAHLMPGVGNVQYVISASACSTFQVPHTDLTARLKATV